MARWSTASPCTTRRSWPAAGSGASTCRTSPTSISAASTWATSGRRCALECLPRLREADWLDAITAHYIGNRQLLTPLPGAVETIKALAARGVPQACVSNSHRLIVDANLDALGIARDMAFTIAFDDVSAGKPDPEPYRLAAQRLALAPQDILAIEDSEAGMVSAATAGLRVALCLPLPIPDRWKNTVTVMPDYPTILNYFEN